MKGYAICTEQRSGSTFLCLLLESTGVMGKPWEPFNPNAASIRGLNDYPRDAESQLKLIPQTSATSNGIYGLKIFSDNFDQIQSVRWAERLPGLLFIHLERIDVLGQAISHCIAMQTQQWASVLERKAEPTYSYRRIDDEVVRILAAQNRWKYYFARNGLPYLHLFYENVVRFPQETVDTIARQLHIQEKPRVDLEAPALKKLTIQRNEINREWRQRYIAESRNMGTLPYLNPSR